MERLEDLWEECRVWEDLIRNRTFETKGSHRQFVPLRTQWMEDRDLVSVERSSRINLCYDLKRRPTDARDVGGIIAFETAPWPNIGTFAEVRDAFDQWRHDRRRVLRTAEDWRCFERWRDARPGRRASGVRGRRPRIVALFLRAYARGELGLPGQDYEDAAEFLTRLGFPTNVSNVKDAKRRGRLDLHHIDCFTLEELTFVEAISNRWPCSRMSDLLMANKLEEG